MLIRHNDGEIKEILSKGYVYPKDGKCTKERAQKIVNHYMNSSVSLIEIHDDINLEMLQYELTLTSTHFMAAVCCSSGLTDWKQICVNRQTTSRFLTFLSIIGDGIELGGFKGYSGHLDVSGSNLDGKYGLYARKQCFELMYHVLPFMPETTVANNSYKEEVFIVFKEDDEIIDLGKLFPSTYCVIFVKPTESINYKVEVWVKRNLKNMNLELCKDEYIVPISNLREYLMYIIINCHYSSSVSNNVTMKRKRDDFLKQIYQKALDTLKNQRFRF